jgi:hypothetical protein
MSNDMQNYARSIGSLPLNNRQIEPFGGGAMGLEA